MAKLPRLQKRKDSGIYYFRAAIPKDLIPVIGKTELKTSLQTSDHRLAKQLALVESVKLNQRFAELRGHSLPTVSITPKTKRINPAPRPLAKDRIRLAELIDRYLNAPEKQQLSLKTKLDYASAYNVIHTLLGSDTIITSIDRAQCRWFQQTVMALPPNATKRFPNMPLAKIAEKAQKEGLAPMSPKNTNKYISSLSILLEWACRECLLEMNPAKGLLVQDVALKDKREPFTPDQIRRIFTSNEMTTHRRNDSPHFWVPLIALYTGARLNEICQLRTADIQTIEGIPCMVISEGDGKQVKTASANRIIPLHPMLIGQGFTRFTDQMQQRGSQRLFPELKDSIRGKPSEQFSKWFTRYSRTIGIKTPKTCFHSFRHNFRDALREAGIDREVVRALGGWSDKGAGSDEIYGKGFSVSTLSQAICRVEAIFVMELSHHF